MKTTPKDFFLHLGATIALYVGAIALINLAFTVADKLLPDNLSTYWSASSIVWPISMLIVLVPLLYVLEWTIRRGISKMPEKAEIWVRRWRIYLTLFLAGATIAVDLIELINTYLNGEVTSRFTWKVLIVLVVAAIIFAYYILDRINKAGKGEMWKKALAWVGIVLVLAGIVSGFAIVGSPATQRALRFDSQRISDLTTLQWQVIDYWQTNAKLPDALQALNDPLTDFSVPVDPQTGASYEYSVKGPTSFELCATFALPSSAETDQQAAMDYPAQPSTQPPMQDSWSHAAGHACFDRTIDPAQYPPVPKAAATI